jgi:hypothetical protein
MEVVCPCHANRVSAPFVELWVSGLQVKGDASAAAQKVVGGPFCDELGGF